MIQIGEKTLPKFKIKKIESPMFELPKFNPLRLFPKALDEVEKVMVEGEKKYPDNDWRDRDPIEHLDHAHAHVESLWLGVGDDIENASHTIARLLMWLEKAKEQINET